MSELEEQKKRLTEALQIVGRLEAAEETKKRLAGALSIIAEMANSFLRKPLTEHKLCRGTLGSIAAMALEALDDTNSLQTYSDLLKEVGVFDERRE